MVKDEFNNLSIQDQVSYINSKLNLSTLRGICSDIGVARSTITSRFKSNGYALDLPQNKYILELQEKNNAVKDKSDVIKKKYQEDQEENIQELIPKIKEMIEWYENQIVDAATISHELNIELDKFKGNAVNRTFVLYENVLTEYLKFCENHRAFKRQDILSQALTEFLEKYN